MKRSLKIQWNYTNTNYEGHSEIITLLGFCYAFGSALVECKPKISMTSEIHWVMSSQTRSSLDRIL